MSYERLFHLKFYQVYFSAGECRTHNSSVVLETDFIGAINNTEATSVYIDMGNSIAISY
jgi:hypothetical protein